MKRSSFGWRYFLLATLLCGWAILGSSQSKRLWQVYAEAGESAFESSRPLTAEVMFLSAIREAKLESVEDPWLGKINYQLGQLYSNSRYQKYDKAESHFLAAMYMWKQCHESDTNEIANCLNALGISLDSQGKQSEAEPFYRQAVGIFEKLKESSNVVIVVANLSSAYCGQDKYPQAQKCVKEGLEFLEQSKTPDAKSMAYLVEKKAMLALAQNRFEEAEGVYRGLQAMGEAAKAYPATLEEDGARRATGLYNGKRSAEAERLLSGEIALLRRQSLSPSLTTANALNEVANLHYRLYRYDAAEAEKRQSIELAKKIRGPDAITDWALADLALIQYAQGKDAEAESLFLESLASMKHRREQSSGEDRKHVATQIAERLERLAEFYRDSDKKEQVAPLYKEALEIREKDLGLDDYDTIATARAYVEELRKLNRDAEANALESRLGQAEK